MNTRYLNQCIYPHIKCKKEEKKKKKRKKNEKIMIRGGFEHITQMTSPGR